MSRGFLLTWALGSGFVVVGCVKPVSVERELAHQRWGSMRNEVLCQLAEDAMASGDLGKAEVQLRQVLSEKPEHVWARTLLATVAVREQRMSEAAVLLRDVATWDDPSAEALNLRGMLDELSQEYASAAGFYAMAWRVDRNRLGLATAGIEAYLAAGDVSSARTLYAECAAGRAGTAGMYVVLAEIERADGKKGLAATLYRRAMALAGLRGERNERWIAMELAGLYREMGRGASGARLVRELWEDETFVERERAGWELARCLASTGEADEALGVVGVLCGRGSLDGGKMTDRDLRDEPVDCDAMKAEVWYLAGRHFAMAEDWGRALAAIDRAGSGMEMRVDSLMLEAVVAGKLGRVDRARLAIERWERVSPDDPMIAVVRNGVGAGM